MTTRIRFDCETNGFLEHLDRVWCLGYEVVGTEDYRVAVGHDEIAEALELMADADELIGHNIIAFDVPALQKVFPGFNPRGVLTDTLVQARVIWANAKEKDSQLINIPGKLRGKHSLEAWGYRLKMLKGEFKPEHYTDRNGEPCTWATIDQSEEGFAAMVDYCALDVKVTARLHERILKALDEHPWAECLELEHAVQNIIARQIRQGWMLDVPAAEALVVQLLQDKVRLEDRLRETFLPFYVRDGKPMVPKRDNARFGYSEGAEFQKLKLVDFNPGSRDHIAHRLIHMFDWVPVDFTDAGKPKVDEKTLETLAHIPEAALCIEYLTTCKRLGQIAEGKQAWLNHVRDDGRIHGAVNANGAVTGRMTHFAPNVAQADKWGPMRACWIVPRGKKLVGCDAEGIELRNLGHYQHPYDLGVFGRAVVEGSSADGTDAHSMTMRAIGFNSRDNAKTFRYALMYGAGDFKLGLTTLEDFDEEKKRRFYARYPAGPKRQTAIVRLGKKRRKALMDGIDGFSDLVDAIKDKAKKQGWLKGLDGRRIYTRAQHSALNTLLQSAGAVVMKWALVQMDEEFQRRGWVPGKHYEFCANVHDEVQIEADEEIAHEIGRIAADAIRLAGEHYRFRVPLAGKYDVGDNWSQTH